MRATSGFDIEGVDIGLAVSLGALREVLTGLSIDRKKWWIACDPRDALDTHVLTIGHGDPNCIDRVNTLYFDVPVLNDSKPTTGVDGLILLLDSSIIWAVDAGLYMEDGRVLEDPFTDLECFYEPIRNALIDRLRQE
ncbi:MAG: hypothetical protein WA708_00515 [Acidobacteriaceae bacterium]